MDRRLVRRILLVIFCLVGTLSANSTYDLRFTNQMAQESVADDHIDITLEIKANSESFRLGTSNLVFTFDPNIFRNPRLLDAINFSGGMYNQVTVTQPAGDRVSVNIELFAINYGDTVRTDFMDVVTIRFDRADLNEIPNFAWRTLSPNATIVFADDQRTIMNYGTLYQYNDPGPHQPAPVATQQGESSVRLHANYPNPFNPETTVEFELNDQERPVHLAVYNMLGQEVRELRNGLLLPGFYRATWDGRNNYGQEQASGVYFLRLSSGETVQLRRMMLIR